MKNGVYSILKARFLINEEANAAKNWRFIVFLILLAIIMIANNNNVDQKVFKIVLAAILKTGTAITQSNGLQLSTKSAKF